MKRCPYLLGALLVCVSASAAAQDASRDAPTATAAGLDLSLPTQPLQYRSDPTYAKDPPGTFYGDKSGKRASATVSAQQRLAARAEQCQGELHGSVAAGMGYSSHGGNRNWQGVNLNSCKTYYDDDGNPREVGISISVGRSDGPDFSRGRFGPGPAW